MQRSGQPPDERGEHGAVRLLQARSRMGAPEHGDLVSQHEELDVLGAGRAAHQQDKAEHVLEDQILEPHRHGGDHAWAPPIIYHRWSRQVQHCEPHRFGEHSNSVKRDVATLQERIKR